MALSLPESVLRVARSWGVCHCGGGSSQVAVTVVPFSRLCRQFADTATRTGLNEELDGSKHRACLLVWPDPHDTNTCASLPPVDRVLSRLKHTPMPHHGGCLDSCAGQKVGPTGKLPMALMESEYRASMPWCPEHQHSLERSCRVMRRQLQLPWVMLTSELPKPLCQRP